MTTSKYTLPKGVMIAGEKINPNTSTGDFEVMLVGENVRQKEANVYAPTIVGKFRFDLLTDSWYLDGNLTSIEGIQDALTQGLMLLRRTYLLENHHKINKGE